MRTRDIKTTLRRRKATFLVIFVTLRRMHTGVASALLIALISAAGSAQAQGDPAAEYPGKAIRILVGFTPGGGPDITARYIAQKLGEAWKQQVLVENRPGAGGTIAAGIVARAGADGYTLLSVSSAHAIAAAIYPQLPYALGELAGITQTGSSKYVLVASPSLGLRSLKELVAAARARPGALNFSSAGVGSGTHFAAEIFRSMAGIEVVHVPFKGIPEALAEAVAGRVHFFLAPMANAVNQVKEGKLLGLGVSSLERDALLPEVPTVDEAGVPGYRPELWFGLLAPASVPRPIVAKLNREIVRILAEPDLKQRWEAIGIEPRPTSPEAFDRLVREEVALFMKIARTSNIKAD
jgi:tripartite-type tricarboxylate transporter receptor subunit TctC